jgi:hypothetical protein
MFIQAQSRQFGGNIDLANLINRKTGIERYEHCDEPTHDNRITVANEGQIAIFYGYMQSDL